MRKPVMASLAVIVILGVIISVSMVIRDSTDQQPAPVSPPSRRTAVHSQQQPPSKPDPGLLVDADDFGGFVSTEEQVFSRTTAMSSPYWSKAGKSVMLEPRPSAVLAETLGHVIGLEWSGDGKHVICASRDRICKVSVPAASKVDIFRAADISFVSFAPDCGAIAVVSRDQLDLVRDDGERLGHYVLRSRIYSAAWSPDSQRLACSTRNTVRVIEPGKGLFTLTRHVHMQDIFEDPRVWRDVIRIDSLSWSASGRYLAYTAHIKGYYDEPILAVYDIRAGSRKLISEGYSPEDNAYSWTPAEDWMVVIGSYGEVDTCIVLRQISTDDAFYLHCSGPSSVLGEISWRPFSDSFAVSAAYASPIDQFSPEHDVLEAVSAVYIQRLDWDRLQKEWRLSEGEMDRLRALPLSAKPPAGKRIPDFDWSPDGSLYAFVDRFYTFRQWNEARMVESGSRPSRSFPGEPLAVLRVQRADEDERIVFGDGESPAFPRFSPDGLQLAYVSRQKDSDTLLVIPITSGPRGEKPADEWLRKGLELADKGSLDAAVPALRNAVRLRPADRKAHEALAKVYQALARRETNPYRRHRFLQAALFESKQAESP